MNQSFPKSRRLLKPYQFDEVQSKGLVVSDEVLVIKVLWQPQQATRLGLAISRQVGNAVVRNRWKRIVREAFRQELKNLPPELDLVIRPRRGAVPNLASVIRSLSRLCHQATRRRKRN